jgi:hypothetical protein
MLKTFVRAMKPLLGGGIQVCPENIVSFGQLFADIFCHKRRLLNSSWSASLDEGSHAKLRTRKKQRVIFS